MLDYFQKSGNCDVYNSQAGHLLRNIRGAMNYEIKPADEKGFTLFYRGIEIGTAKLHCDAVLVAKRLDKEFELEFHRGAKTPELMLETQKIKTEIQNKILEVRADIARRKMKEQEKEQEKENRCRVHGDQLPCINCT